MAVSSWETCREDRGKWGGDGAEGAMPSAPRELAAGRTLPRSLWGVALHTRILDFWTAERAFSLQGEEKALLGKTCPGSDCSLWFGFLVLLS